MAPRLLAPLSSGSDSSKAEEIPDAAPVQQETFSVSLGPDRADTTVFSSKVSGELITSVVADAEGNASLSGHGYQLKKVSSSWATIAGKTQLASTTGPLLRPTRWDSPTIQKLQRE